MKEKTILSLLEETVNKVPESFFMQVSVNSLTYRQLWQLVNEKSVLYKKEGKQVRCVMYAKNSLAWLIHFLSIVCNSGQVVLIDPKFPLTFLIKQLEEAKADFIIVDEESESKLKELPSNDALPEVIKLKDEANYTNKPLEAEVNNFIRPNENTTAIISYTSGSASVPKGVMLTHGQICASVVNNFGSSYKGANKACLILIPFSHVSGLFPVLFSIYGGARIVLPKSLRITDIIAAIKFGEAQNSIVPPIFIELICKNILKQINSKPYFYRKLISLFTTTIKLICLVNLNLGISLARKIFKKIHHEIGDSFLCFYSVGARLPEVYASRMIAFGFYIYNVYGLSETSGGISMNPNLIALPKSVGKPYSDMKVKIKDPDSKGIGEILISGPQIMKGYLGNVEENTLSEDGFIFTGDLGYLDRENNLYIISRIKNMILTSDGKNIYPEDIEEQFLKNELIEEVCAFPILINGGEELAVAVKFNEGVVDQSNNHAAMEMLNTVNNSMPYFIRSKYLFIEYDPFPKSETGKTLRGEVQKKFTQS